MKKQMLAVALLLGLCNICYMSQRERGQKKSRDSRMFLIEMQLSRGWQHCGGDLGQLWGMLRRGRSRTAPREVGAGLFGVDEEHLVPASDESIFRKGEVVVCDLDGEFIYAEYVGPGLSSDDSTAVQHKLFVGARQDGFPCPIRNVSAGKIFKLQT